MCQFKLYRPSPVYYPFVLQEERRIVQGIINSLFHLVQSVFDGFPDQDGGYRLVFHGDENEVFSVFLFYLNTVCFSEVAGVNLIRLCHQGCACCFRKLLKVFHLQLLESQYIAVPEQGFNIRIYIPFGKEHICS